MSEGESFASYLRHVFPFGPIHEVLIDVVFKMVKPPPRWDTIGAFVYCEHPIKKNTKRHTQG